MIGQSTKGGELFLEKVFDWSFCCKYFFFPKTKKIYFKFWKTDGFA
jgi:hypothetical protein